MTSRQTLTDKLTDSQPERRPLMDKTESRNRQRVKADRHQDIQSDRQRHGESYTGIKENKIHFSPNRKSLNHKISSDFENPTQSNVTTIRQNISHQIHFQYQWTTKNTIKISLNAAKKKTRTHSAGRCSLSRTFRNKTTKFNVFTQIKPGYSPKSF